MKPYLIPLAALLVAQPSCLAAQAARPGDGETRVWLTGSSNLHAFTCRAAEVGTSEPLPAAAAADPPAPDTAGGRLTLRIPVAGLDCGIGRMNRDLRQALHADRHPAIRFTLADYELLPGDSAWSVRLNGELDIAGVTRPVSIGAAVETDSAGVTHVRGTHPVRVTDYGVQPPRRFMGLLRVREEVTVHFDVALPAPRASAARVSQPPE